MANPEQLCYSACSEETSSICDEDKIKQLFQVCDNDRDGYIDSHDLATVCQDLNLEYCLDDLMQELGADRNGKISYEEFLQKRLSLKPEIDALRKKTRVDSLLTSSDLSLGPPSLGKHECWEFDSGARDLSPEPNTLQRLVEAAGGSSLANSSSGSLLQLANKLHLAALSSLRTEILDLNSKLQIVTEERDMYEKALDKSQCMSEENISVQQYEEQITELHSVIAELSRKLELQKNLVITEEDEYTDTQSIISHTVEPDQISLAEEEDQQQELQEESEIDEKSERNEEKRGNDLKINLNNKPNNDLIVNSSSEQIISSCPNCIQLQKENENLKILIEKLQFELESKSKIKKENCFPESYVDDEPVIKIAEKVQLKKILNHNNHIFESESNLGVTTTEVAEQLVSSLQEECNLQELCQIDPKFIEIETEKINSKLEHVTIQNTMLQMTIDKMKTNAERLTLLLGKYESNMIAINLVLNISNEIIENYKQLINQININDNTNTKDLNNNNGKLILQKIQKLTENKYKIKNTIVKLESYQNTILEEEEQINNNKEHNKMKNNYKNLDLEMAILMQELLSIREEKAELKYKIYNLENEKSILEIKLNCYQQKQINIEQKQINNQQLKEETKTNCQIQEYSKEMKKNCQQQQRFNEEIKINRNLNNKEINLNFYIDHDKHIENKYHHNVYNNLLQRIITNYEYKQLQFKQLINSLELNNKNLIEKYNKCQKKYQSRLKKLESEIIIMSEKHNQQIEHLKYRIIQLEANK